MLNIKRNIIVEYQAHDDSGENFLKKHLSRETLRKGHRHRMHGYPVYPVTESEDKKIQQELMNYRGSMG